MIVELKNGNPNEIHGEAIEHERLSIIGYSDIEWGRRYQKFPMPLLILDNELDSVVQEIKGKRRRTFKTITPDFELPNVFLNYGYFGNVEMQGEETEGKGYIYLANATWPSDADAYILGHSLPFCPENELAYVEKCQKIQCK